MTFVKYLHDVELWIDELTDGVISYTDLPNYADGDCSPAECMDEGLTPRACAVRILKESGFPL